jgi:hypothetical protein
MAMFEMLGLKTREAFKNGRPAQNANINKV